MSVLFLVVPLAVILVAVAVWAYVWSARGGQFDDLDTPSVRMLHDDEAVVSRDPAASARSGAPSSTDGPR